MIDSNSDGSEAEAPGGRSRWIQRGIVVAVCALVVGVYAYTAHSGFLAAPSLNPADSYYNLLVQGFRAGQLNLKTDVPPGLAELADPYDPAANSRYDVLDLSYYKGKLYLFYGVTPAVVLFWPYVALTGHYLLQKDAAAIFCLVGFLAGTNLLCALWRRYFAEVSVWVVAAGTLALGLATFTPPLLARCDVYEACISCAYAFVMLALAAIWRALHEPERRCRWLAAASLAYGLALGGRPSLLFGAVILLAPVVQARRERQRVWMSLIAAISPLALIGFGLMIYNALRFDDPFEFGNHYQLARVRELGQHLFSLRYLWFSFRVYFLEPAHWSGRFPFVRGIRVPPVPAGHGPVEIPFGVLTNVPLVWLALAAPLAWQRRSAGARSTLSGFLAAVVALFGISALTLCLFFTASYRYEVELLSPLVLLAVVGILGLERALAPTSESGLAAQPVGQRTMRWGWGILLVFSVAFNLLMSFKQCAVAQSNLGALLARQGRLEEAIGHFQQAVRLEQDFAQVQYNLGTALLGAGRVREAIGHFEQALRIAPDYADTQWIDYADGHYNLGFALEKLGRTHEAIAHYEQALRFKPDFAEAHYNLGIALAQTGKIAEAIAHYEQALRIKPDFTEARNALARLQAQ